MHYLKQGQCRNRLNTLRAGFKVDLIFRSNNTDVPFLGSSSKQVKHVDLLSSESNKHKKKKLGYCFSKQQSLFNKEFKFLVLFIDLNELNK